LPVPVRNFGPGVALQATMSRLRLTLPFSAMAAGQIIRAGLLAGAVAGICAGATAPAGLAAGPDPLPASEIRERTEALDLPERTAPPVGTASGGVGEEPPPPANGGSLFPGERMVAFYGAPQLTRTALGRWSPKNAARKLRKQARPYRKHGDRPVIRSFNLIGVIATASPGRDRLYRTRQPDALINRYLKRVRRFGGRLTIDIQPGRSPIMAELRALRGWIAQPEVDVGIDPEWAVGSKGVPGRTKGKVTAKELNRASRFIERLVDENGLPPKAMIVHQFHEGSVRKPRRIKQRRGVAVTLNFDGIGSPAGKAAGYKRLAVRGLFDGFSLFYLRDNPLMKPRAVLRLRPRADYVMYQ
jgi:hypothetical protein